MKKLTLLAIVSSGALASFLLAASTFKIYFTPSVTGGTTSIEGDFLGVLAFTPSRARQVIDLESHGNSAIYCDLKNADPSGSSQRITQLSGIYSFAAGEQNAITGVQLLQSIEGSPLSGATVTISPATEFTITGVSLPAGNTCALLIQTEGRPVGTSTLSLRATFVP